MKCMKGGLNEEIRCENKSYIEPQTLIFMRNLKIMLCKSRYIH